jgi:hypothetical protein
LSWLCVAVDCAGTARPPALVTLVRGVDTPEGTSSSAMASGAGTPFVIRRSWPCGCVTVILVGGLASGAASALRAVAERFLVRLRAPLRVFEGVFSAICASLTSSKGAACVDRRVVTELASRVMFGDLVCLLGRSVAARKAGRGEWAIVVRCARSHFQNVIAGNAIELA